MSHAATNWAIQRRGLKPIAKVLLWHLADCHNPVAGCFPTQSYLAEQCEISRASVNRYLADLEEIGLIRREQVIDQASKRQRPTRYFLAFEEGFVPLDVARRVSAGDTEAVSQESPSRVSENEVSVSQSCETLTCKGTSKEPMGALAFFDRVLKKFPHRRGASMQEAATALGLVATADWPLLEAAVDRQRALFDADCVARNETADERSRYVPFFATWLAKGDWREVVTQAPTAEEIVVSAPGEEVFEAVARLRRKRPVVGNSGRASFLRSEVDRALKAKAAAA